MKLSSLSIVIRSKTTRSMRVAIPALLVILAFTSCRRESAPGPLPNRDITAVSDNSRAEWMFNDILKQGDAAYKTGVGGCIQSVEIDMAAQPHTMLVDFGQENCQGPNGVWRRGRLMVTFTGPYAEPGTIITITPQDYYVNDHLVQGVKTVTNAGQNELGQTYHEVVVNGTVTAPNGSWTSTHSAQRTRTWVQGEDTPSFLDDAWTITGGGNGINRNGIPYTVQITTPLRVEAGCPWIVSGVQQVVPQGLPVRTIDHGNGTCDAAATVTVGNFTFVVGG
jgi:hypothetical protein